jgi:hypothetical protein
MGVQVLPVSRFPSFDLVSLDFRLIVRESIDHDGSMKNTLVFFLGGCTQTEISALRWMNGQAKGRKYIVATTHILNGSTVSLVVIDRVS